MEVNDQTLGVLQGLLSNALSHDNATRKGAESYLEQHEATPGFPLLVLSLIQRLMTPSSAQDVAIRQSASVFFKNVVKKRWAPLEDDDKQPIGENDKLLIKNNLVELMTSAPPDVQKQLAEAVSIISKHDFPHKWESLLPQLLSMLAKNDLMVNRGVMLTANSIMKKFRHVVKSDDLFSVILFCLEHIAKPLLLQFQNNGELIMRCATNIPQLEVLLETQRLIARIFYSLNWQDIPEVFEDNARGWMTEFSKYLSYSNPVLVDNDEENESGPIEKLQAAILDNISMYATQYEDVFEPFLPEFTQLVWKLLIEVDSKPKYDILATSAIKFLTSVASKQHNVGLFTDAVIRDIVQHIVVKNLTATENDEELFEDNPTDYIRKDMEGSDQDSRRRCAIDLVRSLMRFFSSQVTQLCLGYIKTLLEQYASNRDWRLKDTALHLILAVGVKTGTVSTGASELNAEVDIMQLFSNHILPEIHDTNVNLNPIVKADAIKLVCVFRSQLPAAFLVQLLPHIVRFLYSKHVVIQTYAAICIEKFLTLKDRDVSGVSNQRLTREDVASLLQPMFGGLFAVLENPNLSENEYVMKCIMRTVVLAGDDITRVLDLILSPLMRSLEKVCKNPINPHYNHYLFECLALSVKAACGSGTGNILESQIIACGQFEALLFPLFQNVLAQDIAEFVPYVFQILAQLLNARPPKSGLSDAYRALFAPLLSPALWERKGNVPALIDLFKAYLSRGMSEIIAGNNLPGVLGIFQKLLSSKVTEAQAFQLLTTIFAFASINDLQPYLTTIFNLLLQRLQDSVKTSKKVFYCKLFFHCLFVFAIVHGAPVLHDHLESITKGLVSMLVLNILSENREHWNLSEAELKQTLVGGSKLLCETAVAANPDTWRSLFTSLQAIAVHQPAKRPEINLDEELAEDRAFDSTYSKLSFANVPSVDVCPEVVSGAVFFGTQVSKLTALRPGQYGGLISASLSAEAAAQFQILLQQNGLSIQ